MYEKMKNNQSVTPMVLTNTEKQDFFYQWKKSCPRSHELHTAESTVFFSLLVLLYAFPGIYIGHSAELHSFRYFHTRGSTHEDVNPNILYTDLNRNKGRIE